MTFEKTILLLTASLNGWLASWLFIAATICLSCQPSSGQSILPFGSTWEYLNPADGIDPSVNDGDFQTTWHTPANYDGPAFSSPKPAMLGYGTIEGNSIVTDISAPPSGDRYTAYFRKVIETTQNHESIKIEVQADDGGVLYLDGEEIAVLNYQGADEYFGLALAPAEEGSANTVLINGLEAGKHVVAFSLHNYSPTSSDLGFDLQLSRLEGSQVLEFLTWTDSNGEVTITGSSSEASGSLEIPEIIDGMPVTTIGTSAFAECGANFFL